MRTTLVAVASAVALVSFGSAAGGTASAPLCFGKKATVKGLRGTPKADVIIGTPRADVILGLGGDDLICAGAGNDRVNGGPGADRVDLGPGDDVREASAGDDLIWGGPGNDRLFGGPGNDRIWGGPGDDLLDGGPGMDRGWGQGGSDTCLSIEVVATCEGTTDTGETVEVTILRITHYHPPGAASSFACVDYEGTEGAAYVLVVTGAGVRGPVQETGTFGQGPEHWAFDIFSGGALGFDLKATKGGKSAEAMKTYTVPDPGPAANVGDPSCKK